MNVRLISSPVVVAVLLFAAKQGVASQQSVPIEPGSMAPPLAVGKWLKGSPVPKLLPGQVYVIEFWATWCGPCKEAIPHLTELQKKYAGKATFIGVSVWESNEDDIAPFLKEFGEKVGYALVRDKVLSDKKDRLDGAMSDTWLKAAGVDGIPSTFIVNKEGKIAWIGLPSKLEDTLAKVLDGSWDIAAFAQKYRAAKRGPQSLKECYDAVKKGQWAEALKLSEEALSYGNIDANTLKYAALFKLGKLEEAKIQGQVVLNLFKENWSLLEHFARTIVEPPVLSDNSDLDLAFSAVERAYSMMGQWPTATTLAHVYFLRGNHAKAIEILERALASMTSELDKPYREKFEKRLEQYKKGT